MNLGRWLDSPAEADETPALEQKDTPQDWPATLEAREQQEKLRYEQDKKVVGTCAWILEQPRDRSCLTVNEQYQVSWPGRKLGDRIVLQACITSFAKPFDLRVIDPGTAATTLLSLQAVDTTAVASIEKESCVDTFKVLLTPKHLESLKLKRLYYVSASIVGEYQGLQLDETEPTNLVIRATKVTPTLKPDR